MAEQALNDKAGYLHSLLFKMLHIHTVPTLRFFHDDHLLRSIEMSRLIDQAMGVESPTSEDDSDAFDDTKIKG
ncbi:30S ribosome-binding factor RbfA [Oligella ureolytica]